MDQVKTLIVISRADLSGGPEHVYQLLRHTNDVEFHIACPREEPYFSRYNEELQGRSIVEIEHRGLSLRTLRTLQDYVKVNGIDVIHSHGKAAGVYGRLLGTLCGRPVIHTYHGVHTKEYGTLSYLAYWVAERAMSLLARRIICVSEGERDDLLGRKLSAPRRVVVIENGVVVPEWRTPLEEEGPLKVIAVNRYDVQKYPELLVDIADELNKRGEGDAIQIEVLGKGEGMEPIRADIEARGLAHILRIVGPVNAPRDYFQRSDCFLSTSRWEGLPLSVLEAMSEGLPVVATDVVGNNDVLKGTDAGFLFSVDSAEEGAQKLISMKDREVRHAMARVAHKLIEERYSADVMTRRTVSLYRECLE